MHTLDVVLTIAQAADRVGRSPDTIRRWIREGRIASASENGRRVIDVAELDRLRDGPYPMLALPPEWQHLDDGTPAPNWVAAIAVARHGQ